MGEIVSVFGTEVAGGAQKKSNPLSVIGIMSGLITVTMNATAACYHP